MNYEKFEADSVEGDWNELNRQLNIILIDKTTGEARKRVLAAEVNMGRGMGLIAYWNLHDWFKSMSGIGLADMRHRVMVPTRVDNEAELTGAIDKWKWECGELERLDPACGTLPEKYRITALKCILPERLRDYIDEREDELRTYEAIEGKVIQWAMRKRRDVNSASGPVPMDCGMVNQTREGKGGTFT